MPFLKVSHGAGKDSTRLHQHLVKIGFAAELILQLYMKLTQPRKLLLELSKLLFHAVQQLAPARFLCRPRARDELVHIPRWSNIYVHLFHL